MKISLATNFDDQLIDEIKNYPIYEIYGKLKHDILGGGRPDNTLDNLEKDRFEKHVKKVRENNIKFNYLLNGSCTENLEQNDEWVKEFISFLEYLKNIGVNALTITSPNILQLVKKNFDCFTIRVSTFSCVDTFKKALYWESIGADIICVDFVKINRDFKTLKYMVDNLKKSKVEILMTNSCLKECPLIYTHTTSLAHASNKFNDGKTYEDWCLHRCQELELLDLSEYIKSPWVRPEDVKYYEEIGIEHFKITERGFPTDELVKRIKAYCNGNYDGNLIDLIQGHGWDKGNINNKIVDRIDELNTRSEIIAEIEKIRGMGCERKYPKHIYIDNKKLDGFIDYFVKGNCPNNCDTCNYCKNISKKVIKENEEVSNYLKKLYKKLNEFKF